MQAFAAKRQDYLTDETAATVHEEKLSARLENLRQRVDAVYFADNDDILAKVSARGQVVDNSLLQQQIATDQRMQLLVQYMMVMQGAMDD